MKLSELYGVSINDILNADTLSIKYQKEIVFPNKRKISKKITVIGCGRWGTFIAWYLSEIGHEVSLYGREASAKMQKLLETRENEYLQLSDNIELVTDLKGIENAEYIIISIPAQKLQDIVYELNQYRIENKTIVLCMKGIEISTGRRLSQVLSDGVEENNNVAVWLGPGHVEEFYRGVPNCMVIDSTKEIVKDMLIRDFSSDLIRFYYGTDLIGNEVGAAAKNVIGIAAGMLDGLDLSSLKGALMSRGSNEIAKLIVAMGGKASTVYGLCHLGDYEATLFSEHSHNLSYGKAIVLQNKYCELAEGYYTVKALHNLSKAYGVEMPICEVVYRILYENAKPTEMLQKLFSRSLRNEFV
ncbi:MAG: NAD(P)H-dependent glycerol-3-phosphate dehydrogenase [Lachnospiraceae bacterium]|nr:NAD(P)H-dependent glycerol-3-phosphate dehydrogenase [Lachnospiraceae bacterium]